MNWQNAARTNKHNQLDNDTQRLRHTVQHSFSQQILHRPSSVTKRRRRHWILGASVLNYTKSCRHWKKRIEEDWTTGKSRCRVKQTWMVNSTKRKPKIGTKKRNENCSVKDWKTARAENRTKHMTDKHHRPHPRMRSRVLVWQGTKIERSKTGDECLKTETQTKEERENRSEEMRDWKSKS